MGQRRAVRVLRFFVAGSVEERIMEVGAARRGGGAAPADAPARRGGVPRHDPHAHDLAGSIRADRQVLRQAELAVLFRAPALPAPADGAAAEESEEELLDADEYGGERAETEFAAALAALAAPGGSGAHAAAAAAFARGGPGAAPRRSKAGLAAARAAAAAAAAEVVIDVGPLGRPRSAQQEAPTPPRRQAAEVDLAADEPIGSGSGGGSGSGAAPAAARRAPGGRLSPADAEMMIDVGPLGPLRPAPAPAPKPKPKSAPKPAPAHRAPAPAPPAALQAAHLAGGAPAEGGRPRRAAAKRDYAALEDGAGRGDE
jgi:hypothetical protein